MRKHNHYFKDVTHLTEVDVYRVCKLFGINDPSGALQHAIKKLLVAGGRGAGKDETRDIKEAIDTLQRYLEMKREDNNEPAPEAEIKECLLDIMTELGMCCGSIADKSKLADLGGKLQRLVERL